MMSLRLKRFFSAPVFLLAVLFLASGFLAGLPSYADTVHEKDKERLEVYKDKIKEHETKVDEIKTKEDSVFNRLRRIQRLLEKKKSELRELIKKKEKTASNIVTTTEKIRRLKEKTGLQQKMLEKRTVALYKLSDMQFLKILFSSKSYVDVLKRYKYLKLVLNQDSELISEYLAMKEELFKKTGTLKKEKEKLDETIKKVKNKEDEVLAERNSKRILLLKVRREKGYYLKAIKELDFAAGKLEELILKFQNDSTGSKIIYKEKFKDFKKVLETPVNAAVVSFFGKEFVSRLDSYLFNKGIRFSSDIGQAVRAVFSGEVIYSDWFRGYGRVIIISHGDGYYSIYSHLSELLKNSGDDVNRGDIVAKSGDTGSLTGPSLYFEIRHKGHSLDPLDWLEPTVERVKKAEIIKR
jgi:septal ring factor EnvC (AmiA/AmiB activator)